MFQTEALGVHFEIIAELSSIAPLIDEKSGIQFS